MRPWVSLSAAILLLGAAAPGQARLSAAGGTEPRDESLVDETESSPGPAPQETVAASTLRQRVGRYLLDSQKRWDMNLEGGTQIWIVRSNTVIAPAVGLRLRPAASAWSMELGAALPRNAPGALEGISERPDNTLYTAQVNSLYEVHVNGNYALPHGAQNWVAPEVGFGVSMLQVTDEIHADTVFSGTFQSNGVTVPFSFVSVQTYERRRFSFSPLARIGVALFPEHLFSLHLDAAYIGYANTITAAGRTFDLGLSGFLIRTTLQVRL